MAENITIDKQLLMTLVPLSGLAMDMIGELEEKLRTETITTGRYVFKLGSTDNEVTYLVAGATVQDQPKCAFGIVFTDQDDGAVEKGSLEFAVIQDEFSLQVF